MSDIYTLSYEEAQASVDPDVEFYYTLEFRHPAFLENNQLVAIRVVTDVWEDMIFGIEEGAAMNGGESALFRAIPFRADPPVFEEGKMPSVTVTLDNCGREMAKYLDEAVKYKADLIVVFREYSGSDLSEPCYGPVEFVMRNVKVTGTSVSGVAQLDNLANTKFPRRVYTLRDFPGLAP